LNKGKTLRLDDTWFAAAIPHITHAPVSKSEQGIYFFIDENVVPVPVSIDKNLVLGRLDKGEAAGRGPFMDLSWSYAHKLGVSRRHAVITRNGSALKIRDLNSTNGTYLNEERLVAGRFYDLHHEDYIHLGRLQIQIHIDAVGVSAE